MLSKEKMSEAEVTLRVAFHLITQALIVSDVEVAIDGAQVQIGDKVQFPIADFLRENGWTKLGDARVWQGAYAHPQWQPKIHVHSNPGQGDLVGRLRSGALIRIECKKGSLVRSKSAQEYRLLQEAIGQVVTIDRVRDDDILGVAVPHSDKFANLARRWRDVPLIQKCNIRLMTVDRENHVEGLNL